MTRPRPLPLRYLRPSCGTVATRAGRSWLCGRWRRQVGLRVPRSVRVCQHRAPPAGPFCVVHRVIRQPHHAVGVPHLIAGQRGRQRHSDARADGDLDAAYRDRGHDLLVDAVGDLPRQVAVDRAVTHGHELVAGRTREHITVS